MLLIAKKRIFLTALLFSFPVLLLSETFCIQNQDQLLNSLATASHNNENDVLQIVQGSEIKDLKLPSELGYITKIEGGYSFDCTDRISQPVVKSETKQLSSLSKILFEPQQNTTGPTPPENISSKEETLKASAVAGGTDVTVLGVPAYAWRHGCGPTALGMVIGYWDIKGYDKLFEGSATTQTSSVDQGIASENGISGHYEDYSLPEDYYPNLLEDKSELPVGDEHVSDSIADFMFTSWSAENNYYGWSWSHHMTIAFNNYVQYRNSSYIASTRTYRYSSDLTWDILTNEIDAQRPMLFLVDSSGNGSTDHFVTIVGYRIEGDIQYYGCLDTWSPYDTIRWEEFRGMSSDYDWGIYGGYSFEIEDISKPIVAPWIILLLDN